MITVISASPDGDLAMTFFSGLHVRLCKQCNSTFVSASSWLLVKLCSVDIESGVILLQSLHVEKKISLVRSMSRTFVLLIEMTSRTNSVSLVLLSPFLRNSLKSLGILDSCDQTIILLETPSLFLSHDLRDFS